MTKHFCTQHFIVHFNEKKTTHFFFYKPYFMNASYCNIQRCTLSTNKLENEVCVCLTNENKVRGGGSLKRAEVNFKL